MSVTQLRICIMYSLKRRLSFLPLQTSLLPHHLKSVYLGMVPDFFTKFANSGRYVRRKVVSRWWESGIRGGDQGQTWIQGYSLQKHFLISWLSPHFSEIEIESLHTFFKLQIEVEPPKKKAKPSTKSKSKKVIQEMVHSETVLFSVSLTLGLQIVK